MKPLTNEHPNLVGLAYHVCVMGPEFLTMDPFEPGRLHADSLRNSHSEPEMIEFVQELRTTLQNRAINFEAHPLVESYPEMKNDHFYQAIALYINYFEGEFDFLT